MNFFTCSLAVMVTLHSLLCARRAATHGDLVHRGRRGPGLASRVGGAGDATVPGSYALVPLEALRANQGTPAEPGGGATTAALRARPIGWLTEQAAKGDRPSGACTSGKLVRARGGVNIQRTLQVA